MMQDDSNGESTFEFVDKKVEGMSLDNVAKQERMAGTAPGLSSLVSSDVAAAAPSAVPYLSTVPPPSALPSFVPTVSTSLPGPVPANPLSSSSNPVAPATVLLAPTTIPTTLPSITQSSTGVTPSLPASASSASSNKFYPTKFSPVIPANTGGSPSYDVSPGSVENDPTGANGLISWMRGAVGSGGQILSKVAVKAKHSMDSMITTLDPQMRDFIYSGGAVNIIIASEQDAIVHPIRDAFQAVFGKATVVGMPVDISKVAAAQPVGFTAGIKAAQEKITALRTTHKLPADQAVLAVENIVVEVGENKWFDVSVLLLNDPVRNVTLEAFTQMTPVNPTVVGMAQEDTPKEYPLRWSGLSLTIASIMASNLQVSQTEWHQAYMGVSLSELLMISARMLAGLYKSSIGPVL